MQEGPLLSCFPPSDPVCPARKEILPLTILFMMPQAVMRRRRGKHEKRRELALAIPYSLSLSTPQGLFPLNPGARKKHFSFRAFWQGEAKEEEEDGSNSSALHEHAMPGRQKTSTDIPSPAYVYNLIFVTCPFRFGGIRNAGFVLPFFLSTKYDPLWMYARRCRSNILQSHSLRYFSSTLFSFPCVS